MIMNLVDLINEYNMDIHGIIDMSYGLDGHRDQYSKLNTNILLFVPIWGHYIIAQSYFKDKKNIIIEHALLGPESKEDTNIFISSGDEGRLSSTQNPQKILEYYPDIHFWDTEQVTQLNLLDYLENNTTDYNFLILQTNGTEFNILDSYKESLNKFKYVYINTYTTECFEQNTLLFDMDNFMTKYGYKRVYTEWQNSDWGESLYINQM